jgi:hypothetical protein
MSVATRARLRRRRPHAQLAPLRADARRLRHHRGQLARRLRDAAPLRHHRRRRATSAGPSLTWPPIPTWPAGTASRYRAAGSPGSTASPTSTARGPTPGATWSRCNTPASRPTRRDTGEGGGNVAARCRVRSARRSPRRLRGKEVGDHHREVQRRQDRHPERRDDAPQPPAPGDALVDVPRHRLVLHLLASARSSGRPRQTPPKRSTIAPLTMAACGWTRFGRSMAERPPRRASTSQLRPHPTREQGGLLDGARDDALGTKGHAPREDREVGLGGADQ